MSNKKITDLTELTNPTNDDVFPIVDIATNTTQKVQVGNLPIQTAVTTALATKQATLVSGTNIKTINGTSVLGSGNIVTPQPSGVAGAIQFSDGSAFASDATNLFWDDTNNRLGVGLNTPATTLDILPPVQTATATQFDCFRVGYSNSTIGITNGSALQVQVATTGSGRYSTTLRLSGSSDTSQAYLKGFDSNGYGVMLDRTSSNLGLFSNNGIKLGNTAFAGSEGAASGMVHIKGSGSTSATTSLLVQNSSGVSSLQVTDDGSVFNYGKGAVTGNTAFGNGALINNTTGNFNSAHGIFALQFNTSGTENCAVGAYTLFQNISGLRNTAIGQNALSNNTTGENNTAIGYNARTGNFSNSIVIGSGATANGSNQFVVGSAGINAGAIDSSAFTQDKRWKVKINGVDYYIALQTA